jgi:DNA-binding NarL/FixJ family response regulator
MSDTWPLVGRAAEVEAIVTALTEGTQPLAVVVAGPAGIGKTHLLRVVAARLRSAGRAVLAGRAMLGADLAPATMFGLHQTTNPDGSTAAEQIDRALVHTRLLRDRAGRVTVMVDDADLVGPLTDAFVALAVDEGAALVVAHRDGTTAPKCVEELHRAGRTRTVQLAALSRTETAYLLAQVLDGPVAPTTAADLWKLAGGNPLVLRELIAATRIDGSLRRHAGTWRWSGRLTVSATLSDLVLGNVERLCPDVRHVLELVALSEPVTLPILRAVAPETALADAETSAFLDVDTGPRPSIVRLAHPLYGEVIRAATPAVRRQHHQRMLAGAAEKLGLDSDTDRLRVAEWKLDSDTVDDPGVLLDGARIAYSQLNIERAVRLAAAALARDGGLDAAEFYATLLTFSGDSDRAAWALDRMSSQIRTDAHRARWAIAEGVLAFAGRDDAETPDRLDAIAERMDDPVPRLTVLAHSAPMRLWSGDVAGAGPTLDKVVADPRTPSDVRSFAETFRATILAVRGQPVTALTRLSESEGETAHLPYLFNAAQQARCMAYLIGGDLTGLTASVAGQAMHHIAARAAMWSSFPLLEAELMLHRAQALRMAGRPIAARQWALEAAHRSQANARVFLSGAYAEAAHSAALAGSVAEADQLLKQADQVHQPTMDLLYPWIELARIQVRASQGDVTGACDLARRLAGRLAAGGLYGFEVHAWQTLARFGRVDADVAHRLTDLASGQPGSDACEGPLPTIAVRHAVAALAADPHALRSAAAGYAGAGMYLLAAEAAVQALATALEAGSNDVVDLANDTATMLSRCDRLHTPALNLNRPPLSTREAEVVDHIMSHKQVGAVAERLNRSPRTIEQHLHRAYRKLGVRDRATLAALHPVLRALRVVA